MLNAKHDDRDATAKRYQRSFDIQILKYYDADYNILRYYDSEVDNVDKTRMYVAFEQC